MLKNLQLTCLWCLFRQSSEIQEIWCWLVIHHSLLPGNWGGGWVGGGCCALAGHSGPRFGVRPKTKFLISYSYFTVHIHTLPGPCAENVIEKLPSIQKLWMFEVRQYSPMWVLARPHDRYEFALFIILAKYVQISKYPI